MSGRRKGQQGEREAIGALRALGLDARGVRRQRGAVPDLDVVIFGPKGTVAAQVKREERPRLDEWRRDFVATGRIVMFRTNHRPWVVLAVHGREPLTLTVEQLAASLGVRS